MRNQLAILLAVTSAVAIQAAGPPPPGPACTDCPNIILLLTDDQDLVLGGWTDTVMRNAFDQIVHQGSTATDWRIHTPICAPSRSQLQTGRYYHNIKSNETTPSPAVSSGAVAQVAVSDEVYPYQFATTLRQQAGYRTALFAKCMNGDCGARTSESDPTKSRDLHLMGAYDRWFEHAGYVNGKFFDNEAKGCEWPYNDDPSGPCQTKTFEGGIWAGKGDGYDTSTAGNLTVDWINEQAGGDRPWFVYYAPHAPHSPATPAKWYETGTFCDNVTAPRLPNFNYSGTPRTSWSPEPPSGPPPFGNEPVSWWNGTEFHELVSSSPYFTAKDVAAIDDLAQHRCKALLSVDDSYKAILEAAAADTSRATYVLVTSDHGYNLGNHMLPSNKFLLYEHSMRIPMVFQGPGIAANSSFDFMGTNVDVAPTILELAGIKPPAYIDGRSVLPHLISDADAAGVPGSVKRSLSRNPTKPVRTDQFVTYFSQGTWIVDGRPLDDWSNTYIGLTHRDSDGHYKFGIYDPYGKQTNFTKPYMFELFDLDADPFELHNIYNHTKATNPQLIDHLSAVTYSYYGCAGNQCPQ